MITVTIQIGNSDNKLTQIEWSHYVSAIKYEIEHRAHEVHFFGGSPNWFPWQNAAWVIIASVEKLSLLRAQLSSIRQGFEQDSVAWTVGETEFI